MVVRLGCGYEPWENAFRAQTVALSRVIDAIYAQAGLVSPRTVDMLPTTLVGRTALLDGTRQSAPPPQVLFARKDEFKKGNAGELEVGDLVDVTTRFRFVLVKGPDNLPRPNIRMEFVRVVRLESGSELTKVCWLVCTAEVRLTHAMTEPRGPIFFASRRAEIRLHQ